MKLNEFDFFLPDDLIAQEPLDKRDESKLMVLDRDNKRIKHNKFINVIDYMNKGDCLILNNTKVIPARIFGFCKKTGFKIEFLLTERINNTKWKAMVKPGKRAKAGKIFIIEDNLLSAKVVEILENGQRVLDFNYNGSFSKILEKVGNVPLPPYIKKQLINKDRYQTVYADKKGSIAAPTAGLHFSSDLLRDIEYKGVNIEYITLHVGIGTFKPVKVDDITEHKMHSEYFTIDKKTTNSINEAKSKNKKIIGVGTTTVRALETIAQNNKSIIEYEGFTNIFIYPGFEFKVIDSLITNFHLPKSTLLMLVSAFADKKFIEEAYKNAIKNDYRFFSFGDAMLIL